MLGADLRQAVQLVRENHQRIDELLDEQQPLAGLRGARLARLLAAEQLGSWGLPLDPARFVVAELAANAVLHGRVPGRSFRLTLSVTASRTLRVEVADTRGDHLPGRARADAEAPAESG